eukprot:GHVH01007205.1.p1 GENE.GHVH01007205.1~~GHVH01007205.1.p1  ORF type:complete len:725 (+),score=67.74 GHVH01007205.1:311-2485(+)
MSLMQDPLMFEPAVAMLEPQEPVEEITRDAAVDSIPPNKRFDGILKMLHEGTSKHDYAAQQNWNAKLLSQSASSPHYNQQSLPSHRSPQNTRRIDNPTWIPNQMDSVTLDSSKRFQTPNFHASHDLLRLIQPHRTPKAIPFIPHNAYSICPISGSMIPPYARDIIPQGLPVNRVPQGTWQCIQSGSHFNSQFVPSAEDEEERGLSGMDRVLYTRSETARRVASEEYNVVCKARAFDLTISMPIQVPYGTIACDVLSGEHYYGIMGVNGTSEHSDHALFGRGVSASKTMSQREAKEDPEGADKIPDFTASHFPCACDVWSSFLTIKLGVIYNVRQDQFRIVGENVKNWFSSINFERPIEFIANGVYATNSSVGLIQSPPSRSRGIKYVTHLRPKTSNDVAKFIQVRQKIKSFASQLGFHFGGAANNPTYLGSSTTGEYQPLIGVELDANLSSERIKNGLIQVEVRSYDSDDLPESFAADIWKSDGRQPPLYTNATKDHILSKVEATEIRLEHDRGHVVDPRWPRELIIARRIASHDAPGKEAVVRPEHYARHVFCTNKSPQTIVYRGKFKDLAKDEKKVFVTNKKLDGKIVKECLLRTRFKREFQAYVQCEPRAGDCTPVHGAQSPVHAPLPKPYNKPLPPMCTTSVTTSWNVNATPFKPSGNNQKTNKGSSPHNKKHSKKKTGGIISGKNATHPDGSIHAAKRTTTTKGCGKTRQPEQQTSSVM